MNPINQVFILLKMIRSKKFKIGIWGTGYIGLSTMVYFSKKKIKCVGFDINKEKIKKINSGGLPLADLKKWFGFDIKSLVKSNYLKATSNYKKLITEEFLVHFIAIPTEKSGKPYYKPLLSVLSNITKINKNAKISFLLRLLILQSIIQYNYYSYKPR